MSKVVYYAAMSLDGYIADPDDDLDWLTGFEAVPPGPDVQVAGEGWPQDYEEFYADVGALVSGSVTYEWIVGGSSVASQFADAGLLDEVVATVVPVVLGAGKPLLECPLPGPPMRLLASLPRPSGMVELRFEVRRAT